MAETAEKSRKAKRESSRAEVPAAALIDQDLATTGQRLRGSRAADPVQRAHDRWLGALLADRERLEQILKDRRHPVAVPPGSPIGDQDCWLCAASAVTTVDAR